MTATTQRFFMLSPTCAARARLEEAEQYYLQNNLNEALAAAQQAWREHPQEPDVFRILAYLHMARGEFPPAESAGTQAIRLDGKNPASYAALCQVYVTFNLLRPAEDTLNAALAQFPDDPSLLSLGADITLRRGKKDEAVSLARRALKFNPDDGYARVLLGRHYLGRNQYAEAVPMLDRAVAMYPQRWDFLRDLGIALLCRRDVHPAFETLVRAFRLNRMDAPLMQYLFLALRLMKQRNTWHWWTTLYFYRHRALSWVLVIGGIMAMFIGGIWVISALSLLTPDTGPEVAIPALLWPSLVFFGGLFAILFPRAAISLQGRKGSRFEEYLLHAVEDVGTP